MPSPDGVLYTFVSMNSFHPPIKHPELVSNDIPNNESKEKFKTLNETNSAKSFLTYVQTLIFLEVGGAMHMYPGALKASHKTKEHLVNKQTTACIWLLYETMIEKQYYSHGNYVKLLKTSQTSLQYSDYVAGFASTYLVHCDFNHQSRIGVTSPEYFFRRSFCFHFDRAGVIFGRVASAAIWASSLGYRAAVDYQFSVPFFGPRL